MNTEVVVAILGSAALGSILAAIANGFFSKKKLGAEATKIIADAAAGVVTSMQADLNRQVQRMEEREQEHDEAMRRMAAAHVKEREEWKRVLDLHVAWDAIAIGKLAEFGVQLPATPPVLPQSRYVDKDGYPI